MEDDIYGGFFASGPATATQAPDDVYGHFFDTDRPDPATAYREAGRSWAKRAEPGVLRSTGDSWNRPEPSAARINDR